MIFLIDPSNYAAHRTDLDDMYRLRHRVFVEKLNWQVNSHNGMEKDEYDECNTHYIVYKDHVGRVRGCQRLIEMTNNSMFNGPFKFMLPRYEYFKRQGYWEVTRMAVDNKYDEHFTKDEAKEVASKLFMGLIHIGRQLLNVEYYLAVSYPPIVELYKKYGLQISTIKRGEINGEHIISWGFAPLSYTLDQLMKHYDTRGSSRTPPLIWYTGELSFQNQQDYQSPLGMPLSVGNS